MSFLDKLKNKLLTDQDIYANTLNHLEAYTLEAYPKVKELIAKLYNLGANSAMMSGSGPTCFGIFRDTDLLDVAFNKLQKKGFFVYKASKVEQGIEEV